MYLSDIFQQATLKHIKQISQVRSNTTLKRNHTHTHIKKTGKNVCSRKKRRKKNNNALGKLVDLRYNRKCLYMVYEIAVIVRCGNKLGDLPLIF